jgi:hypothetical protein
MIHKMVNNASPEYNNWTINNITLKLYTFIDIGLKSAVFIRIIVLYDLVFEWSPFIINNIAFLGNYLTVFYQNITQW